MGPEDGVYGGSPKAIPIDIEPTWSPDGQRIAYRHWSDIYADSVYPSGLYVVDTTGAGRRLVLQGSWILSPAWSPLGDRIAFSAGGADIMTVSPTGSNLTQVTHIGEAFFPSWSPDGKRLAFDSDSTLQDTKSIWIINSDGIGLTGITRHRTECRQPSWSPEGRRLVYRSWASGVILEEIFTMDTAGGSSVRLTSNSYSDGYPAWSPDGRTIAWAQDDTRTVWVCLMDSDGKNQRHLVEGTYPAWSPDGRCIVFSWVAPSNDRYVLWIIRPDGTGLKQVTH